MGQISGLRRSLGIYMLLLPFVISCIIMPERVLKLLPVCCASRFVGRAEGGNGFSDTLWHGNALLHQGLGLPHSLQNLPEFTVPQLQVQSAAGLGFPHSLQNLPELGVPQFGQYHPAVPGPGFIPDCAVPTGAPAPVSYTHLDVYKRQFEPSRPGSLPKRRQAGFQETGQRPARHRPEQRRHISRQIRRAAGI